MKNVINLAFNRYVKVASSASEPELTLTHVDDPATNCTRCMTKEEFVAACKEDDRMVVMWVKPVILDLMVILNESLQGAEFPNSVKDFKEKYPSTFDSIVDLMARCIMLSDEDFRQIVSFK